MYSYAIIYAKGTDHLNSVTELQNSADFVQSHYDAMSTSCFDLQVATIDENQELEFAVYLNPTNGKYTIHWPSEETATAEIIDAHGRKVKIRAIYSGANVIETILESGIYFVNITTPRGSAMQRLVIR